MGFFDNFGQKKKGTGIVPAAQGSASLPALPIINASVAQGSVSLPAPPIPKKKTATPIPPLPKKGAKNQTPKKIPGIEPITLNETPTSPPPLPPLSDSLPKKESLFETSPVQSLPSEIEKTTTISVSNPPKKIEQVYQSQPVINSFENIQIPQTYVVPDRLPNLSVPRPSNNLLPSFKQYEDVPITFVEEDLVELPEIPVFQTLTPELDETNFTVSGVSKQGPLFIRTDNYGQILTNIDTMQNYIKESPNIIYMLKNLKKNTDLEHKNYAKTLEDIQRKLIYVDNVLFATMREIE